MATPYQIKISPEQTGLLRIDQTAEAADKATEFLQKDLQVPPDMASRPAPRD